MKHIKTIVIGSAIAVTAGAGAVSAGNPVAAPADPVITQPAPPVLTTDDWTGAYIGSALGYGDYSIGGTSGNGASLGGYAGYDYDFGNYVAGAELQYLGNDINIGGTALNQVTRVKARLGYDAGSTLVYGVGGYTNAKSSAGNGDGYVAGVGMEYRFNNGVSLGAEYLYNEYDNFAGSGNDLTGNTIEARLGFRF
ncbi:outer membrane protein [Pseudooceanicola nitratireducens]|uniref:outer membrane protein n=1 Tax=Pseudooceanicola nitratireducens TaxID=517719 RepID=UPI003C7A7BCF